MNVFTPAPLLKAVSIKHVRQLLLITSSYNRLSVSEIWQTDTGLYVPKETAQQRICGKEDR